tara:strand:+ start:3549 stop:4355 length:807 start_codon:yes stop_codon:yes gene_type:complete
MAAASFDEVIAHTPLGDGRFRTSTPPEWLATSRSPGGLVGAQLFTGLQALVPDQDFRPRSFTIHLLRAPEDGHYEVHAEVLRVGRTLVSLSGRVIQGEKLIATGLGSFGTDRPGPEFDEMPMPAVEPPSADNETEAYVPDFALPFSKNIVLQDRLGPAPFTAPDGPMERVGWAGFVQPRPVDAAGLVLISDIGMMGWWVRLDRMHTTATLDHTMHFRADLDGNVPSGMVLMRSRTGLVRGGYLDWDVDIWSQDGTLLCQSRQLLAVLD